MEMLNEIALVGYIRSEISVGVVDGLLLARFELETKNFALSQRVMNEEISLHQVVCAGRFATQLSDLNPVENTILCLKGRIKTAPLLCKECQLARTTEIWVERKEDSLKAGSPSKDNFIEKRAM